MTVFQILVFRNNAWIKLRIMFVNALKDLQEKNCDENVDDCIKNPGLSHINGYTTTHKYILYNIASKYCSTVIILHLFQIY